MGNELSCPCGNSSQIEEEPQNKTKEIDIIDQVMKGKLTKDELLYEYSCENKKKSLKICLLSSSNIEGFFKNRNLLIIEPKQEINLYYNTVFISNFLNSDSYICVILQYNKGTIDRSNMYINLLSSSDSKHIYKKDFSALYKTESINFVSSDNEKKKEQILNDLYSQLNKEYLFYGIVNDNSTKNDNSDLSESFKINAKITKIQKNYKILYKKSKLTDNLDIKYSVSIVNEQLTSDLIMKVLSENKDKTLKSVIKEDNFKQKYPYSHFFIFEGNKTTPEYDESEFLVVKPEKEKITPEAFLKDIAEKIILQDGAELLTVINDNSGFFLVFKYHITMEDEDDE